VRKGKGGLGDLGDVDVVVERPVGGAVVIFAAVIVQARHGSPRSRCSSSNAAPSSRVLLRFALALSPSFRSGVWTLSDFHPGLVGGYIGRDWNRLPALAAFLASWGRLPWLHFF